MGLTGTHGVKVKTNDHGRARWLTPSGGLTGKVIHAALAEPAKAEAYAKDIKESNPDVVEWARAEAIFS